MPDATATATAVAERTAAPAATHYIDTPIFAETVAALGIPPTRSPIILELNPYGGAR